MPKIHLLSEDLINKIAAGEVIERPASVVKELIENSLDAKATKIIVEIQDSGKKLIKVSDNGEGMEQEDAERSLLRHATSKIKDENDLFAIQTLGFRGEALASIAAVSHLKIITKLEHQLEGFFIETESGLLVNSGLAAAERGTTIEVKDLFYNTPARKKFLKTDAVELRHIIDVVIQYALINYSITFKLLHEGHELVNSPAVSDMRSRIASIYGLALAREMLMVQYQNDEVKIAGYIAPPHQARNDKSQQQFYVNKRWVRNHDLVSAVYQGYHSTLFLDKHPVVVLQLELDPATIDVNVHPTKAEIKFEQKEKIQQAVMHAVQETLQNHQLIPLINGELKQQLPLYPVEKEKKQEPKPEAVYSFETGSQATFQVQEDSPVLELKEEIEQAINNPPAFAVEKVAEISASVKFPAMKILGQIHKTFFVAETLGGLFYLDQHAVHERITYERFMEQYGEQGVEVQQLLQGDIVECSPAEKVLILEHMQELEELGFSMELFGERTFIIKTIPLIFGRLQPKEIIYEILDLLHEGKHKVLQTREDIITRMACRAAVMAGDMVTIAEMEKYVQELAQTKLPYTCPHGRPTMFKVSVEELEKKFRRR